jgi:hypothetical protein
MPNLMKIRLVGAELFHVDGRIDRRTDTTKLIVAFRNSANAPKTTDSVNSVNRLVFVMVGECVFCVRNEMNLFADFNSVQL